MPELIEVEIYRSQAEVAVSREISDAIAPDDWYLKGSTSAQGLRAALVGGVVERVGRIGKLLLVEVRQEVDARSALRVSEVAGEGDTVLLGIRFGMTGRLVVDGEAAIEELLYSTSRPDPSYERFRLCFADGGYLAVVDPRRLGGVEIGPDTTRLGVDAATISSDDLAAALGASSVLVKARLLDQRKVAGVGNLIADETFWRVGIDPTRASSSLTSDEVDRLAKALRTTIRVLSGRGGSHTGDLQEERHRDGHCPRDGSELRRSTVGGRTTYWCPEHQV